jgi:hypothetical protein
MMNIGSLSITELAYASLTREHDRTLAAYHTAMTTVSYGPHTAGTPHSTGMCPRTGHSAHSYREYPSR